MRRWFFIILILATGAAIWAFRPQPWTRAQRAIDRGDAARAVQLASRALESKTWPPAREERLREILAEGYLMKGALENADSEWRILRQKFPANFQSALGLGALNLAMDKSGFAEEYLKEAKSLRPDDPRSYALLARLYGGRRDFEKAETELGEGLAGQPGSRALLELRGDILFDRGRYTEARRAYESLLAAYGKDWPLRLKVAETHLWSGEIERAGTILEEMRPKGRTDVEIEFLTALLLSAQGKRDESAALWERLYREDSRRLQAGMAWAVSLAERERIERADDIMKSIEEQLIPLGGLRSPQGALTLQDAERLDLWRRAARQQHISFRLAKTRVAQCAGRYNEARDHLERARSIDGESDAVLWGIIELARLKGEHDEQLKWAERAVSVYKGHPAALLQRARAFLAIGKNPDSVFDVRDVADAYPHMAAAQALLSRAWLMRNHPDKALAAAENAVRLNPGDAEALLALALSLATLERYAEAETAFIRTLGSNPRFAEARYAWAGLLKKQGRKREADIQRGEAIRLEPLVYGKKP